MRRDFEYPEPMPNRERKNEWVRMSDIVIEIVRDAVGASLVNGCPVPLYMFDKLKPKGDA